jgi:hypothetical protein
MQTIPLTPIEQKPWYRFAAPWLLMLGPVFVVLAGIPTAWLAFRGQDALVVDDYYRQGKAINQDLRRDRAAAALGMRMELHYDAAQGKLLGRLAGKAPHAGALQLRLIHSTQPEKDIRLIVQAGPDGRFETPLPTLEKARWQVMVESIKGDWRLAGAWQWPLQQDVALMAQTS